MTIHSLLEEEKQVQAQIFKNLEENRSFYFLAGAGAGKTYALVETLKYSLNQSMQKLDRSGSRIACITYTNAAKNEIIERFYDSNYLCVSTIHSFLWEIIEPYQKELLGVHREYIEQLISDIKYEIYTCDVKGKAPAFKKLRALSQDESLFLNEKIIENTKEIYNCFRCEDASSFWAELESILGGDIYTKIKSSKADVEKILKSIIKISRLEFCAKMIDCKDSKYSTVSYNEKGGREILHKNLIGHDTLIDYSLTMVEKYPLLRRVILDTFPQIYIDEYQDTHTQVIKIMDMLITYSKSHNIDFIVGFFGDPVQSIYSNNELALSIDNELDMVYKNINRRSHGGIVDLINVIRGNHQKIHQKALKNNDESDIFISSYGKEGVDEICFINDKIEEVKIKWKITSKNKLTCMVLRNKTIANLCGFGSLYDIYNNIYCDKSSFLSYASINEEVLSKDIVKLGILPLLILKISTPIFKIKFESDSPLSDVFSDDSLDNHTLEEISTCLDYVRNGGYSSLSEYSSDLLKKSTESDRLKALYSDLAKGWAINSEDINCPDDIVDCLCYSISSSASDKLRDNVKLILSLDLNEIFNWIRFVYKIDIDDEVSYITCHGSKGLEFDNVLAIIDDKFGKDSNNKNVKDKFTKLFVSGFHENHDTDMEKTRNLFYVICSRAIRNLEIALLKEGSVNEEIIFK
ncbi:UvrD-helicase domain-containing protein [Vibrio harveyi]